MKFTMRKVVALVAGALAASISLTACSGASGDEGSADGGVLKIAMTSSDVPFTGPYPDNGY